MKQRSPINFSGILFEVALLTLALVAAITLVRIGSAVAAEDNNPRADVPHIQPSSSDRLNKHLLQLEAQASRQAVPAQRTSPEGQPKR